LNNRQEKALHALRATIQLNPQSWESYLQLGELFHAAQAFNEAISCYNKSLSLNNNHFEALFQLGLAYQDAGKPQLAVDVYKKAIQSEPTADSVYVNLGTAYQMMGQHGKAIPCYEQAVRRSADNPTAHMNMGTAYASIGQHEKATRCYETAVRLKPDYHKAVCYLYKHYQLNCDWIKAETFGPKLDALTHASLKKGERPEETPFLNISRHADPKLNYAIAHAWSREIEKQCLCRHKPYSHKATPANQKTVKLGYLSNTFCYHPGAQLVLQLFGLHDRRHFEVYCYSYGVDDGSLYRKKIEADADRFVDIRRLSDKDAADQIFSDSVDILIDLRGFTRGGRLGISAYRPAPIQVIWLGYPGTSGASFIDYIITDKIISPPQHRDYFSEHFVYLPHCYQISDHKQKIADMTPDRKIAGLPESATVFCSFNGHYKIDPVIYEAWMKILHRIPDSILWLLEGTEQTRANLLSVANLHRVKEDRIVFAEKLPKQEHMARLPLADMGLDTRIYGGHTTTTDALWAGVPVIALKGNHFASSVSSSILTAADLPELITDGIDGYIELAVSLAGRKAKLQELRRKIKANHLRTPLFDTPGNVRSIEAAYIKMWNLFCKGEPAREIIVDNQT
jgi:protein O-GlcNAc transferase